jgi:GcrA cell cycle regulator
MSDDPDVVNYVKPVSLWTEERVARLRHLWDLQWSCSKIAADLGPDVSRNAVIGKVHRLRLPARGKKPKPTDPAPKAPKALGPEIEPVISPAVSPEPKKPVRISALTGRPLTSSVKPEPVLSRIEPPPVEPVFLVDLRPNQCRFPTVEVARATYCYCAKPVVEGQSWCEEHFEVCFWPQARTRLRWAS